MITLDMSEYVGVFLDEGREQLLLLESGILEMERGDHSAETLQAIFRAAHTLKGSSRAMGFLAVGDLTHEMENVLDDLRHQKLQIAAPIVNALLDCLDALGSLVEAVAASGTDLGAADTDIPALVTRLAALRQPEEPGPAAVSAPVAEIGTAGKTVVLSDFELTCAADAQAAGLSLFSLQITLSADCMMKSVRVFMVLGALEPLGTVVAARPSEEALEAEEFEHSFALVFATERSQAEVEAALGTISELDSVVVILWHQEAEHNAEPSPLSLPAPHFPPAALLEPEAAKAPAEPAPARAASSQTIRVEVARLDGLMNLVGELLIERTQIGQYGKTLYARCPQEEASGRLLEATSRIARITAELQEQIMKARMLPIDGVFQRMPRMVRDLAQKTGKEVDFRMSGGETELDRSVLEAIGDPLIHLLRNSVDHGVEPPAERLQAGKPASGTVTLSARHEENHIVVEITDDGGGINPVKLKAAAVAKGVLSEAAAAEMTDKDALGLIFASGFSTAQTLSDISGRGVGMDIVRSNLEKLGGQVLVDSTVGQGSCFTIRLPLTLAIIRALLVEAGKETYVVPLSPVVEMLRLGTRPGETEKRRVNGRAVILLRGRTIPLISLASLLHGHPSADAEENIKPNAYVVVVGLGNTQIGLCVDLLLGEQEVVIKPLGPLLGDVPGLSGATILGDGRVALIVDTARAVSSLKKMAA